MVRVEITTEQLQVFSSPDMSSHLCPHTYVLTRTCSPTTMFKRLDNLLSIQEKGVYIISPVAANWARSLGPAHV